LGFFIDRALGRITRRPLELTTPTLQNQELRMKALITAFALLSFIAASTVPYVAQAQTSPTTPTTTTQQTTPHKAKTKKHTAKKKTTKKTVAKNKKKKTTTPASTMSKG
jgi:hypothetical protein